ncbi:MAG: sterol desaturase family protein, partial [Bryobacteraceae bacterium]
MRHLIRNAGIGAIAAAAGQLAVVPAGLATTAWAERHSFGLMHWIHPPGWLSPILAFLLLDFTFYYWHRLNHAVPLLWRFHNVHHVDTDMDVTTALRFHFGEVAFSSLFRIVQLGLLGVSTATYLLFEIVFGAAV